MISVKFCVRQLANGWLAVDNSLQYYCAAQSQMKLNERRSYTFWTRPVFVFLFYCNKFKHQHGQIFQPYVQVNLIQALYFVVLEMRENGQLCIDPKANENQYS